MRSIRWEQRLEHFERAVDRLSAACADDAAPLNELEREGLAQRFEYTFELAWKTLKDYLTWSGVELSPPSPREVIKAATALEMLEDGALWLEMLERRNWLTHAYDAATFEAAVLDIRARYVGALAASAAWFVAHRSQP
jgi:nucleotidyltransferase substrate binding protein (TIGR01987 family)